MVRASLVGKEAKVVLTIQSWASLRTPPPHTHTHTPLPLPPTTGKEHWGLSGDVSIFLDDLHVPTRSSVRELLRQWLDHALWLLPKSTSSSSISASSSSSATTATGGGHHAKASSFGDGGKAIEASHALPSCGAAGSLATMEGGLSYLEELHVFGAARSVNRKPFDSQPHISACSQSEPVYSSTASPSTHPNPNPNTNLN